MEELECSQNFPHYNPMGAICCHGNLEFSSDLAENLMQPFPHPNDAPDEILISIDLLVSEIFMFENVNGRAHTQTDAGSSPKL